MARLLESGLCACLLLLPLVQSGGKERGKEKKPKEAPKSSAPAAAVHLQVCTGKLAEARKLARERNAGLLIHVLLKEMESENQEYRRRFLEDPAMQGACARLILLVSDNGEHPSKTIEETVDGKKVTRTACSVYPWYSTCSQHQQNFNDLALEYREEDGSMSCPQAILQAPDGSVTARLNTRGVPDAGEILSGIAEQQKKFGPGLLESEWNELVHVLEDARAAQTAKSWPDALRKWARVREITPSSAYGAEAAKAASAAEQGLQAQIEHECEGLVPGSAAAAWRRLAELQRACAGLPAEKEIAARLRKAETQKDIQAEIAAVKLESEADALLHSAQESADAKKDKELEKTVRKLLGKRYAATQAAARARELWPDWAADEAKKSAK